MSRPVCTSVSFHRGGWMDFGPFGHADWHVFTFREALKAHQPHRCDRLHALTNSWTSLILRTTHLDGHGVPDNVVSCALRPPSAAPFRVNGSLTEPIDLTAGVCVCRRAICWHRSAPARARRWRSVVFHLGITSNKTDVVAGLSPLNSATSPCAVAILPLPGLHRPVRLHASHTTTAKFTASSFTSGRATSSTASILRRAPLTTHLQDHKSCFEGATKYTSAASLRQTRKLAGWAGGRVTDNV
jgi:hypothetical protein